MLPVEEACARILEAAKALPTETVSLVDSSGRVLAEEVRSTRAIPPRDNSAMDGYGVRAADITAASDESPVELKVVYAQLAGDSVERSEVRAGEACRIMTGAPIPPGVDAVVMRELTDEAAVRQEGQDATGEVKVQRAVPVGEAIRRRGEDVADGAVVGAPGDEVTPARLNLLAQSGAVSVVVHRRPTVGVLSSGDELKEIGDKLTDDDIVNSNAYAIAAAARSTGAEVRLLGIARDTLEDHRAKLEAASDLDVVLTIGGVSVGTHDFVRPALEAVGAELDFWKVAMRPGKPLAFGRRGDQLLLGLPGNPVSSQVSFELFVRPALRKLGGHLDVRRRTVRASLVGEGLKKRAGVAFYARARTTLNDDGTFTSRLEGKQGSGQASGLARANSLVVISPEAAGVHDGERVDVLLLDDTPFFVAEPVSPS